MFKCQDASDHKENHGVNGFGLERFGRFNIIIFCFLPVYDCELSVWSSLPKKSDHVKPFHLSLDVNSKALKKKIRPYQLVYTVLGRASQRLLDTNDNVGWALKIIRDPISFSSTTHIS